MSYIEALRTRLNWSQSRMAGYLGMSQAGVHNMERTGRLKRPVRLMLEALAAEHGIILSDGAGGETSSAGVALPAGAEPALAPQPGDAEPCGGGSCA